MIFEGVRGTSYLGDIAIDDVSLTAGSCSQGMDLVSVRLRKMFKICNAEIVIMIFLIREVGKLIIIKVAYYHDLCRFLSMQPPPPQALAPKCPPLTAPLRVLTSASIYRTPQIASTGHARLEPRILGSQVHPMTIPMAQQQVFQML